MISKKKLFCLLSLILALFIVLILCIKIGKPLHWAKTVKSEEIAKIEVTVHPAVEGEGYKEFGINEFDAVADKINQCTGRFTLNPKVPVGGSFVYYVTMKNGEVHTIGNNGMELIIDGVFYTGDRDWLEPWIESVIEEADSPVPESRRSET